MAETKKNIFVKLQEARCKLQDAGLEKSGENKYSGYSYFELSDFLPSINKINKELGLYTEVSFTNEVATLTIINADAPEEVRVFSSPMKAATLKGCHEIQNLGAVQSYERRYLYMAAYEIVEADALEATTGKDTPKEEKKTISEGQQKRLFAISKGNNEVAKKVLSKYGYNSSKEIEASKYEKICSEIEALV